MFSINLLSSFQRTTHILTRMVTVGPKAAHTPIRYTGYSPFSSSRLCIGYGREPCLSADEPSKIGRHPYEKYSVKCICSKYSLYLLCLKRDLGLRLRKLQI